MSGHTQLCQRPDTLPTGAPKQRELGEHTTAESSAAALVAPIQLLTRAVPQVPGRA